MTSCVAWQEVESGERRMRYESDGESSQQDLDAFSSPLQKPPLLFPLSPFLTSSTKISLRHHTIPTFSLRASDFGPHHLASNTKSILL